MAMGPEAVQRGVFSVTPELSSPPAASMMDRPNPSRQATLTSRPLKRGLASVWRLTRWPSPEGVHIDGRDLLVPRGTVSMENRPCIAMPPGTSAIDHPRRTKPSSTHAK